jgi:putative cell wall-binding protein
VILVPGSASAVDSPTLTLLEDLNATEVYIAGGTGVVSSQIEAQLNGIFGAVNVARLAGANRYDTAIAINEALFSTSSTVYLAVGTGYADALAGAALAGKNGAPLFVVPGSCVPASVLTAIDDLGATTVVLFGGVGALSTAVANLTRC